MVADANIGTRPEHLIACPEKNAMIGGTLDLVEQLGEYALVHLNTASGESFVTKMNALPKIAKGEQM